MAVCIASVLWLAAATSTEAGPHQLWDEVLTEHVSDEGLVDYAAIRDDERFAAYVQSLATVDPDALPNDGHRLAFWLNAYNALTIRGILDYLPEDPRQWRAFKPTDIEVEGKTFWQGVTFPVAGRDLTLDQIEHEVIRATPGLRDPRIHVALSCAAVGGPPLLNRAYAGDRVNRQLYDRMRRLANDPQRCRFDPQARTVELCRVFDWYKEDFSSEHFDPRAESVPDFISRYVNDEGLARSLRSEKWSVRYHEFDWRLNVRPKR